MHAIKATSPLTNTSDKLPHDSLFAEFLVNSSGAQGCVLQGREARAEVDFRNRAGRH